MGNIVSNVNSPNTQLNSGSLNGIEGVVDPKAQPTGYGVDPFGQSLSQHLPATQVGTTPAPSQIDPPPVFAVSSGYAKIPDGVELPSITPEIAQAPGPQPAITPPTADNLPSQSNKSAEDILNNIPPLDQMMKDLEKSGCLLPDLHVNQVVHVDKSPLAALQPERVKDEGKFIAPPETQPEKPALPDIQLASTNNQVVLEAPGWEIPLFPVTAIFGLIQAVQGAGQAGHFMFVKYPLYEQFIVDGQLTTLQMNTAVVEAVILLLAAVVAVLVSVVVLVYRPKNKSGLFYGSLFMVVLNFLLQNVMASEHFASGNPLALPIIFTELFAKS